MTRWALTRRGYHNPPDGRRREALPRLQGRHGSRGRSRPRPARSATAEGRDRERAARRPAGRPLGPPDRARARSCSSVLLVVWARRELPLLPQRRRGGERAAAEAGEGEPRASGRPADLEAVDDPPARHRRRHDGGREPTRTAPTRSCSSAPIRAAHRIVVPLDPARPPRRHPRLRHDEDQRRLPGRRAGARDQDGPRAHRACSRTTSRSSTSTASASRDRRARRDRGRRPEADPLEQVRLPVRDRRALRAAGRAGGSRRASRRWTAGARWSTPASARTSSTRRRTTSRAASGSRRSSRRSTGKLDERRDVRASCRSSATSSSSRSRPTSRPASCSSSPGSSSAPTRPRAPLPARRRAARRSAVSRAHRDGGEPERDLDVHGPLGAAAAAARNGLRGRLHGRRGSARLVGRRGLLRRRCPTSSPTSRSRRRRPSSSSPFFARSRARSRSSRSPSP